MIDDQESRLGNGQRNHILLGDLRRMIRSFRVCIHTLQSILPILATTTLPTSRERLSKNLSKQRFLPEPPAHVITKALYLGAEDLALVHQGVDVRFRLFLEPSQRS